MFDVSGAVAALKKDGRLVFHIRREANMLVAEWSGMGTLRATETGSWSEFVPAPGIDPLRIQKLKNGAVLALLRHLEGKLSLHASAVAFDGAAVLCVGDPGAGKSTAAADLCARAGVELVADDVASIELTSTSIDVLPSHETHWLLPESRAALGFASDDPRKRSFPPAARADRRARIAAIVQLVFDDSLLAPELVTLRGAQRFAILNASAFRFRVDEPEANLHDFTQLMDLSERVPVLELRRPRALADLPRAGDVLVALTRGAV
jgi:hypothetical protein